MGPGAFVDLASKIEVWDLPPFAVILNFPSE